MCVTRLMYISVFRKQQRNSLDDMCTRLYAHVYMSRSRRTRIRCLIRMHQSRDIRIRYTYSLYVFVDIRMQVTAVQLSAAFCMCAQCVAQVMDMFIYSYAGKVSWGGCN